MGINSINLEDDASWTLILDESRVRAIANEPIAPIEITSAIKYQFLRVQPINPVASPKWQLGAWLFWLTDKISDRDIVQREFVRVNCRSIFESPSILDYYQLAATIPRYFSQVQLKIWGAIFHELSLYQNSDIPIGSENDSSYELGIRLFFSRNGFIKAIRYYKPIGENGVHIGKIWASNGVLLASVTFDNESVSGWQEQALEPPLSVTAFNQYVVSVNANSVYAQTPQGLLSQKSNVYIYSVADGLNGVFNTNVGDFPESSYGNTDYFRDLTFVQANV